MRRYALLVLTAPVVWSLSVGETRSTALFQAANQSPQSPTPAQPPAGNASPDQPAPTIDPAAAIFAKTAHAGLMMVTVKADRVADYEAVIRALQEGLSRATDARQQALAKGWRVFKADTDPKSNAVFIHLIDPVVATTDYRPSLILDEILAGASADMLAAYRDAIVGAPAMLGMNEFANMATPPPPKPTNGSSDGPRPVKKPGA